MVSVYIGKCYGVSLLTMGTLRMGVDFAYCWPSAQVARIQPEKAVEYIYKKEISKAKRPDKIRKEKLEEILQNYINHPYHAVEQMMASDIIDPIETRSILVKTLENLSSKKIGPKPWKKHGILPQ